MPGRGRPGPTGIMGKAKDVVLITICSLVVLGFLFFAGMRSADVYYKSAWIVTHFPPAGTLCSEPFCLRTDTSKPESRFLELHFAYCPQHLSGGTQGRGRGAVLFFFFAFVVLLFSFLAIPIVGALFRVAAWPVLIPMWLAGKLPRSRLLPYARYADSGRRAPGDWLEPAGMWTGAVIALAAIALYCWW